MSDWEEAEAIHCGIVPLAETTHDPLAPDVHLPALRGERARMTPLVYRVQDRDGRGPWRPGLSHKWIDDTAPAGRLTETVMDLMSIAALRALPRTMHYGSACRSRAALFEWFTPIECTRLATLGFYPVQLRADIVLVESPWQLLIGRSRPFTEGATRLRWSV